MIKSQAAVQKPPLKIIESSWSDWINGKNVPSSPAIARFVIAYLSGRAKKISPSYVGPPEGWWEEMRQRALKERRIGDGRGGRPRKEGLRFSMVADRHRIGILPGVADCFQNRTFRELVDTKVTNARCWIFTGTGGVGKSQLAASYARSAWEEGLHVLVWAAASSRRAILHAYGQAAGQLGISDQRNVEEAAEAFLIWADQTEMSWLVVLDDIQDPSDVRSLWPPHSKYGRVIATTRRRDAALYRQGRQVIQVNQFSNSESLAFLQEKLGPLVADVEQATALADDLGHLPLALAQAAAFMLDRRMPCVQYRLLLNERLLEDAVPESDGLPDDHQLIVTAIWNISIDQADGARPVKMARPLLNFLSVLDPNGIPAAIIDSAPTRRSIATCILGRGERREIDATPEAVTSNQIIEALWLLHRFHLINYEPDATPREVLVHPLIQRAARESLDPSTRKSLGSAAAKSIIANWPNEEKSELSQVLQASTAALWEHAGVAAWDEEGGVKAWREDQVGDFIKGISRQLGVTVRRGGDFVSKRLGSGCGSFVVWNGGGYYNEAFKCGETNSNGITFYCSAKCFYSV
ncbi:NB-ARC domain-containing protein [Streptomyces sp. NPDC058108]|uniref:NB-ARC domain-containing protein n=1 Tax=Streptomyces sp. NPDC058108 TaxID=3346344 RepID=UPI0036E81191